MNEIVKYHNNINKVKIPNLTEYEQNLLMKILVEVKEKTADEIISIPVKSLKDMFNGQRKSDFEIAQYLISLRDNFFKADFEKIRVISDNQVAVDYINLFEKFALIFDEPKTKPKSEWRKFTKLELKISPDFIYTLKDLTKDFTIFELQEFIKVKGKYSKILYRLLKQFKTTGEFITYSKKWEEFCEILEIPINYKMCDIDKRILEPAIKELSNYFKDLRCIKIKDKKARGRGGKVIGIEFRFTPRKELEDNKKISFNKDITKENESKVKKDVGKIVDTQDNNSEWLGFKLFVHPVTDEKTKEYELYTNKILKFQIFDTIEEYKIVSFEEKIDHLEMKLENSQTNSKLVKKIFSKKEFDEFLAKTI